MGSILSPDLIAAIIAHATYDARLSKIVHPLAHDRKFTLSPEPRASFYGYYLSEFTEVLDIPIPAKTKWTCSISVVQGSDMKWRAEYFYRTPGGVTGGGTYDARPNITSELFDSREAAIFSCSGALWRSLNAQIQHHKGTPRELKAARALDTAFTNWIERALNREI